MTPTREADAVWNVMKLVVFAEDTFRLFRVNIVCTLLSRREEDPQVYE